MGIKVGANGFYHSIYKEDKNPSMKLFPGTNSFYDYSSAQGGDLIKLYQDYYRLDVKTAIKEICAIAGIDRTAPIPEREKATTPQPVKEKFNPDILSPDEQEIYFERLGITDDENLALLDVKKRRIEQNSAVFTELYTYCINLEPRIEAINYLDKERMLIAETIEKHKLFHIPDYYKVNQHMKKMFETDVLVRSGLFNSKENNSGSVKNNLIFFSHRIIIPYLHNGIIVYLRGRYFDEQNSPLASNSKYLGLGNDYLGVNTSKRFYNLDVLKTLLAGERIYITEGELDTLVLQQAGVNSIAIPAVGNIPNISQFNRLKNFRVFVLGDKDEAGNKMVEKLKVIFTKLDIDTTILFLKNDRIKDISDLKKL